VVTAPQDGERRGGKVGSDGSATTQAAAERAAEHED
jgi:hypothetical protein